MFDESFSDHVSSSCATENSDDEPLEGEPADHVEAMLSRCLHPDERQNGRERGGEDDDSCSDEDAEALEAVGASGAGSADEAPDSDLEEIEEATALRNHIITLKLGMEDFDGWANACLLCVQEATPMAADATAAAEASTADVNAKTAGNGGDGPAASARAIAAGLRSAIARLRESQQQLRVLALNQQALAAHYTQQMLRLSHAQVEIALRRHNDCRRRHKQLRIVRRESARLCRQLEGHEEAEQRRRREHDDLHDGLPGALLQHLRLGGTSTTQPRSAGRSSSGVAAAATTQEGGGGGAVGALPTPLLGASTPHELRELVVAACGRAAKSLGGSGAGAAPSGVTSPRGRPATSNGAVSRRGGSGARASPTPGLAGGPLASGRVGPNAQQPPWPTFKFGAQPAVKVGPQQVAPQRGPASPLLADATRVLAQPAVQAAVAEALWQLLGEQSLLVDEAGHQHEASSQQTQHA